MGELKATQSTVVARAEQRSESGCPDQRKSRRTKISLPTRLRPEDPALPEEVRSTLNASRDGLYFATWQDSYYPGMRLLVTFPYCSSSIEIGSQNIGRVVRVERLSDGRWGVAVHLLLR